MAKQKWIAISYCLSFLFVYICFIAYVLFPILFRKIGFNFNLPQTETTIAMNSTMAASSLLNSVGSIISIIIIIGVAVIILIIINYTKKSMALGLS